MSKNSRKKRRAATERAVQIELEKGTSKKTLHKKADGNGKKNVGKNKKRNIIIISVISAMLVIAAVITCLFLFVFKKDEEPGAKGISYVYNTELGGYEVYASSKDITSAYIPEEIDGVPVVSIAKFGFSECKSLSSISIPNSIKRIGVGAFNECTALAYTQADDAKYLGNEENPLLVLITVRDDIDSSKHFTTNSSTKIVYDYAFAGLTYRQSVAITGNVIQIGAAAFKDSTKLAEVSIASGVEDIGDYAFQGCSVLETVKFGSANPKMGIALFEDCTSLIDVTLPSGITEIPERMFKKSGIMSIFMPNTVQKIGKNAFESCSALNLSSFPSSLTYIDAYAFSGCGGVSLKGGEDDKNLDQTSLKYIGAYAFRGCKKVEFVKLPKTFESFGIGAFENCTALTTFQIDAEAPVKRLSNLLLRGCEKLSSVFMGGVEEIGNYTFEGCAALDRIPGSGTVRRIGVGAFAYCTNLKSVSIPANVSSISEGAFESCTNLKEITIHKDVKTIGAYAFSGCTALETLNWAEGLENIYEGAFKDCEKLAITSVPASVKYIGYIVESVFLNGEGGEYIIKALGPGAVYYTEGGGSYIPTDDGKYILISFTDSAATSAEIILNTKAIASGAFLGKSKLTEIIIPDSVTFIADYAFAKCSGLKNIIIPNSVTDVMNGAFCDCSALESITLSESLTALSDNLLAGCTSLKALNIPSSVTTVGDSALYYCTALEELSFENIDAITSGGASLLQRFDIYTVVNYEDYRFTSDGGVLYIGNDDNPYLILYKASDKTITSYTAKEGTKFIHSEAFYGCTALTGITIPESVCEIGTMAFYGCTSLTSVSLPSAVKKIPDSAFTGCTSLTSVSLGQIEEVGASAFANCTSLTSLVFTSALKTVGNFCFQGCSALAEIYIPASVQSVGLTLFDGCTALYEVKIGAEYEHEGFAKYFDSDLNIYYDWLAQNVSKNILGYIQVKYGA